jgi:hypothetical protein
MLGMMVVLLNVSMRTVGDEVMVVVAGFTDRLTDYVVFFVFVSEMDVMALKLLVVILMVVILMAVVILMVKMVTFPLVLVRR